MVQVGQARVRKVKVRLGPARRTTRSYFRNLLLRAQNPKAIESLLELETNASKCLLIIPSFSRLRMSPWPASPGPVPATRARARAAPWRAPPGLPPTTACSPPRRPRRRRCSQGSQKSEILWFGHVSQLGHVYYDPLCIIYYSLPLLVSCSYSVLIIVFKLVLLFILNSTSNYSVKEMGIFY